MKKLYFLVLFVAVLLSCSIPDDVGMPTWTTNFRLCFINDSWEITELANDSTLVVNDDGILEFHETVNESQEIEISTGAQITEEEITIGNVEINSPSDKSASIDLAELAPDLVQVNGYPMEIPPFILEESIVELDAFEEFESIIFSSGTMILTLTNNTMIYLGNEENSEPLIAKVYNYENQDSLATITFEDIAPGSAKVKEIDLTGKIFPNTIGINISGGSRGTDGETSVIDTETSIDINVQMENVTASQVTAPIPAQSFSDDVEITLDESIIVCKVQIAEGDYKIQLNIENEIDLAIDAVVNIPQLTLANENNSFTTTINILASGTTSHIIDVAGAIIGEGSPLNFLNAEILITTIDTGENAVTINSTDKVNVTVDVDAFEFESIIGIIELTQQDDISDLIELDINYPEINGELEFVGESEIIFDINSPIPAQLEMEIIAYGDSMIHLQNNDGNPLDINIPTGGSTIAFSSNEYNINEFLSCLPDSITFNLIPTVGDENEVISLISGDSISADINIIAQLALEADCWAVPQKNGKPRITTTDTKEFTQEFFDTFQEGNITFNYLNTTGISLSSDIMIAKDSIYLDEFLDFENPDTNNVSIFTIPFLDENATEGDTVEIIISQNDLEFFLGDSVYIVPKFKLKSDGSTFSGGISLIGELDLKLNIGEHLMDGEE